LPYIACELLTILSLGTIWRTAFACCAAATLAGSVTAEPSSASNASDLLAQTKTPSSLLESWDKPSAPRFDAASDGKTIENPFCLRNLKTSVTRVTKTILPEVMTIFRTFS